MAVVVAAVAVVAGFFGPRYLLRPLDALALIIVLGWAAVVMVGMRIALGRLNQSLAGVLQAPAAIQQFEHGAVRDLPVHSVTAELDNHRSHDYEVSMGAGHLCIGVGVLQRQVSAAGAGQVTVQVLQNGEVLIQDAGPWGVYLEVDLRTSVRWVIRVRCDGPKHCTYLLEYQWLPPHSRTMRALPVAT